MLQQPCVDGGLDFCVSLRDSNFFRLINLAFSARLSLSILFAVFLFLLL